MRCERYKFRAVSRRDKPLDLKARFVAAFLDANLRLAPLGDVFINPRKPAAWWQSGLKNQSCTGCGQRPRQNHLSSAEVIISMPH
jgi:hypothetical protein